MQIHIEVYPRVCGGTPRWTREGEYLYGLSPRVRGNLRQLVHQGDMIGSIPACAGEPSQRTPRFRPAAVYPRVCGGTSPNSMIRA